MDPRAARDINHVFLSFKFKIQLFTLKGERGPAAAFLRGPPGQRTAALRTHNKKAFILKTCAQAFEAADRRGGSTGPAKERPALSEPPTAETRAATLSMCTSLCKGGKTWGRGGEGEGGGFLRNRSNITRLMRVHLLSMRRLPRCPHPFSRCLKNRDESPG